jgi:hypothetical protein
MVVQVVRLPRVTRPATVRGFIRTHPFVAFRPAPASPGGTQTLRR